ncbi:hypothetical protein K437DRAFT_131379 [Tilletiaria anomala UBC 951]|uniref:Uncharacterized protein n=1 Tax=Tilletiaria anomala (strain ATCC 24038 / CBS 436.72 / UBC 951) TaxID=1037660 RepID=A0A066W1N8_TILAU|nr:uncharacterized protein K437DRAFT_131379 [Tilletiaria anomala UBC 951]KDN44710.1 hypothetical protein K437DRAFT_131379 [Tilletiaria anomala UBC 951]
MDDVSKAVERDQPSSSDLQWDEGSAESLDDFIAKNKPSVTKGGPNGRWIWVQVGPGFLPNGSGKDDSTLVTAIAQGIGLFVSAIKRIKEIQADSSTPLRTSKAKGKSKKNHREIVSSKLKDDLKEVAFTSGIDGGRWLFFSDRDHVDALFARISRSLQNGALSKYLQPSEGLAQTGIVKVASADHVQPGSGFHGREDTGERWPIQVYVRSCWNKVHVAEILTALIKDTGTTPSACKADLYSYIGITSDHSAGLRTSLFTPKELLTNDTMDQLKALYRSKNFSEAAKENGGQHKEIDILKLAQVRDEHNEFEDHEGVEVLRREKGKGKAPPAKAKRSNWNRADKSSNDGSMVDVENTPMPPLCKPGVKDSHQGKQSDLQDAEDAASSDTAPEDEQFRAATAPASAPIPFSARGEPADATSNVNNGGSNDKGVQDAEEFSGSETEPDEEQPLPLAANVGEKRKACPSADERTKGPTSANDTTATAHTATSAWTFRRPKSRQERRRDDTDDF